MPTILLEKYGNSKANLICCLKGGLFIGWLRNGKKLRQDIFHKITNGNGYSQLSVNPTMLSPDAKYSCQIATANGVSQNLELSQFRSGNNRKLI